MGKPQESYLWGLVRPISLVDKLVKGSDQIDIYVVPAASGPGRNRWKSWHRKTEKDGRDYWLAAGVTAAVTGAGLLVSAFTGYFAPGFLYLAGVVGLGFFIRSRWAMLPGRGAECPVVEPAVYSPGDDVQDRAAGGRLDVLLFLFGGPFYGTAHFPPEDPRAGRTGTGKKTNALFLYSRAIGSASDVPSLISVAAGQISQIMGVRLAVMAPEGGGGKLRLWETGGEYAMDEKEWSVAVWCMEHRRPAGRFTDTIPVAEGFYLPMMSGERCMGVLGVRPEEGECLTAGQKDLLESMGAQLAMALEREELRAERARTRLMEESEKLHRSLLDSVSHEFKTPLAVIEGGCEKLAGRAASAPEEREEYGEILLAARRLRRLVKNLLDVSRLESGALETQTGLVRSGGCY